MQTIDPALVTALVAPRIAALMVHPDIFKRQLTWQRRPRRERRRRP